MKVPISRWKAKMEIIKEPNKMNIKINRPEHEGKIMEWIFKKTGTWGNEQAEENEEKHIKK